MTVEFDKPVVLLGGGKVPKGQLQRFIADGLILVCADGGANFAMRHGIRPDAIIGDMDSYAGAYDGQIIEIAEQDSTDFEKCLYSVTAPYFIGLGFTGKRVDHTLAAFSTLTKYPNKPVLLLNKHDVIFRCPDQLRVEVPIGTRVSIYPMGNASFASNGLEWPLDGLDMSPSGFIGTSNRTNAAHLYIERQKGEALVILPVDHLEVVLDALTGG